MSTETNQDDVVVDSNEGEGSEEVVTLSKADYAKLNETIGSMKRELKDARKPKDTVVETPQTKTEEFGLLQKSYLRSAGITDADEVELAKGMSKKWGMDVDVLVDDEDFKAKLEKIRTTKANAKATNVEGGSGSSGGAKDSIDYWSQKGELPSSKDVSDRKTRANLHREMAKRSRGGTGGKFYNE